MNGSMAKYGKLGEVNPVVTPDRFSAGSKLRVILIS